MCPPCVCGRSPLWRVAHGGRARQMPRPPWRRTSRGPSAAAPGHRGGGSRGAATRRRRRWVRASSVRMRVRPSRPTASRYSCSTGSPLPSSARERAWIPSAQSVPAALVISTRNRRATSGALRLSGPGRRLDQLDRGPGGQPQLVGVFAALLGCRQRPVIAAQAVIEHGVRPVRERDADSLAAQRNVLCGGPDQRGGLGFLAAQHGQAQGCVRRQVAARGLRRRLHLLGQRRRRGQLAGEQQQVGA